MLFYACRPDARPFFRLCLHTALSVCHMGVRKWLEKSAEKQKQKLRKTLNPLSRKAFQAVSFSATKDNPPLKSLISEGVSYSLSIAAQNLNTITDAS